MKVRLASAPAPLADQEARRQTMHSSGLQGNVDPRGPQEVKGKGLEVRISGSGWATAQQPAAGRPAAGEPILHRYFSMGSMRGSDAPFAPDARIDPLRTTGQPDGEVASVCYDSRLCGEGTFSWRSPA